MKSGETKVERMLEGWLVRGALDTLQAKNILLASLTGEPVEQARVEKATQMYGTFRKVPGQWSNWILVESKPGRGAFNAHVFYTDGRVYTTS